MAGFFKSYDTTIADIPIILWPAKDASPGFSIAKSYAGIVEHMQKLYTVNPSLHKGELHIVIAWTDGSDAMLDIWVFDQIKSWGSGPLIDVRTYRHFERVQDIGCGAGDGLILLGIEEQYRRSFPDLASYLAADEPHLPPELDGITPFSP